MMASVYDLREAESKKPRKVRPASRRQLTTAMPKDLENEDADLEEDVTAPKRQNSQARFLNQSIFGMITQAGGKADFPARFDEDSSDSSEDGRGPSKMAQTTGALPRPSSNSGRVGFERAVSRSGSRRSMLQRLSLRPIREPGADDNDEPEGMSSSQILARPRAAPSPSPKPLGTDEPLLARQLEADAAMREAEKEKDKDESAAEIAQLRDASTSLPKKLMEMFGFDEPEEVIAECKCWLLQSALLSGYMYVTEKHLCFYAYLPKRASTIAKSGPLAKRGKRNPRYRPYYFELKGDVLTYYRDPTAKYFPSGNIDLRAAISAATATTSDKGKDDTYFSLTTGDTLVHFKAGTAEDAKSWVKHIQKAIFRAHNEGDAVKISLPLANILEIEEASILGCAEAVKIRIIDNDETYAIDEYFFSFFEGAHDAVQLLRDMIADNDLRERKQGDDAEELGSSDTQTSSTADLNDGDDSESHARQGLRSPQLREHVREMISPLRADPRRISRLDTTESDEPVNRPMDESRSESSRTPSPSPKQRSRTMASQILQRPEQLSQQSTPTDSPRTASQYTEAPSEAVIESLNDTSGSASQVLSTSDVFRKPKVREATSTQPAKETIQVEAGGRPSSAQRRSTRRAAREGGSNDDLPLQNQRATKRPSRPARPIYSSGQVPTLQDLVKAGAYPLQRASGIAGYIKDRSKQMSSLLASESMGYYEKVSDMWAGGGRHYGSLGGLAPGDDFKDVEDDTDASGAAQRFRSHFALPASEQLIASYYTYMHRVLPLYGKIYIGNKHVCYRSLLPGTRTKIVVPLKDVEAANKEKGYRIGYCALVVVIRGHEEIFFDFTSIGVRDDCAITLILSMEAARSSLKASGLLSEDGNAVAEAARAEYDALKTTGLADREEGTDSIIIETGRSLVANVKSPEPMRITCLTIGSRGDVQPYIALCKRLMEQGHKPRIATHAEFEPWVRSYGIDFVAVGGDPAELMRICVENGMFTVSFLREATTKFRGWLDELMVSAWQACQGSDLLIESPSAMAGIHIAEALGIPYFRAFTMPWTRTRAYPHAFAVPENRMGGAYNYMTYIMFDTIFWKAIAGQVNRWRQKTLGIGPTTFERMQPNKVPFLYNFSPAVVVPPLDYSDWTRVTGYWFLDEGKNYTPPDDLAAFIAKARADGKKLVYVGFGSIVVDDPAALTQSVIDSVLKADVRCILSKGWSDRLGGDKNKQPAPTSDLEAAAAASAELHAPVIRRKDPELPASIFQIQSAPHDWLFSQIDAAVHHGGAGTTGASLRAGIPTIAKPFFGDQFFFGQRLENLGVGICLKVINTTVLARALWEATHDERMRKRARALGEEIRKEDGVGVAVQALWRDLEYARGLVAAKTQRGGGEKGDASRTEGNPEGILGVTDVETWTFVGDESDPELVKRKEAHLWDPEQKRGGVLEG